MSVRRTLIVLLVLTLGLPALTFALRANRLQEGGPSQNIQLYTVQRGNLEEAITAVGSIEAEAVAGLSFSAPGRVIEIIVAPGDYVLAGDPLLRVDDEPQRIAYAQAVEQLELAAIRKEQLLQGPDEADVRIAEANLASAQGAYQSIVSAVSPEDIRAAEIRVQAAEQALDDAIQTRATASLGQPEAAYQLLDAQVGAASFNLEIARLQLEATRTANRGQLGAAAARIAQAQRQLELALAGPTQAQIDQADIAIRQAQAQVEQAQMALERTILTAPFAGIVSTINAEQGALVTVGLPVVQLVDVSALLLTVQVDEIDIRQVREGMPARVRIDALPGLVLPATIERIALVGRSDNGIISYDVLVTLDESDPRVRVGLTAEAAVVIQERRDVVIVPNLYVRLDREQGRAFVNVLQPDGSLSEVEVTLGLRGQESSEVLTGLQVGDVVAAELGSDAIPFFGG